MKKILSLLLLKLLPVIVLAQLHFIGKIGADTHIKPIYTLGVGYEIGNLSLDGEIRPDMTKDNTNYHNYMGGKIGWNLINPGNAYLLARSIIASVGYYYDRIVDGGAKIGINKWHVAYSFKFIKMFNDEGGLEVETMWINKSVSVSAGIHFKIITNNKNYETRKRRGKSYSNFT